MTYAIIIILLLCLIYHYDYQGHTRYRLGWYITLMVIFILLAGLRYRLGVDSIRYERTYPTLPTLSQYFNFDFDSIRYGKGYLLLNAVARSISDNFVVMQCILAIFVNAILFDFFYRNTSKIFFAVLLYFILQFVNYNFEILRESCAVATFVFAWRYFSTNKWFKYYLCAIVAILFHPSAGITLIVPLTRLPILSRIFKINSWTPWLILGVLGVGVIISKSFVDLITLIQITDIQDYADTYKDTHYIEGKGLNIIGMTTTFLNAVCYPGITGWFIAKGKTLDRQTRNLNYKNSLEAMLMCYIYIAVLVISIRLFYRFNNYFFPFFALAFSDVIFHKLKFNRKKYKLSFGVWSLILAPFILINIYGYLEVMGDYGIRKYHRYYPYDSVIFKEKDKTRERLFMNEGA